MIIQQAFAKIVNDAVFYADARDVMARAELTSIQQHTLELINKFFEKYQKMPKRDEMLLFLEELPASERERTKDYTAFVKQIYTGAPDIEGNVLLTEMRTQIEKARLKKWLIGTGDKFDEMSPVDIYHSMGDMLFKQDETMIAKRIEVQAENVRYNMPLVRYKDTERIPTMMSGIDHETYGGVGVHEFVCVVAPSGRGKTALLINLMYGFMLQGHSVMYITLEMSVVDILRRFYRRVLTQGKDMFTAQHDAENIKGLERYFKLGKAGGRIVYFPANSLTPEDVKVELFRLEMRKQFMPEVIIIDHLDLMTSRTQSVRQKEMYAYWRLIVDELRTIPLTRSIPVITATQGNRQSSEKKVVTEVDVGESYGKIQSSDIVMSVNQTPEERQNKRMRLCMVKNRDHLGGAQVEIFSDLDMMLMCDLVYAQKSGYI